MKQMKEPQILNRPRPRGPAAQRPLRPPPRDHDPAAEEVLGLVPPTRPPAVMSSAPPGQAGRGDPGPNKSYDNNGPRGPQGQQGPRGPPGPGQHQVWVT